MRNFPKALLVVAALAAATPAVAAAPNPGTVSDVRCLLTMLVIRQNKDLANQAQSGIFFFAGRINARDPNADLISILKSEGPKVSGKAVVEPELKRCGAIFDGEMQSVQAALTALRPPGPPPGAAAPGAAAPGAPAKPPAAPAPAATAPPAAPPPK